MKHSLVEYNPTNNDYCFYYRWWHGDNGHNLLTDKEKIELIHMLDFDLFECDVGFTIVCIEGSMPNVEKDVMPTLNAVLDRLEIFLSEYFYKSPGEAECIGREE